jgi:glutamine synthetase
MKKADVLKKCEQNNVRFIHLQFCDLLGVLKSVTIPFVKLSDAIDNNVWFDGSSIEGFARTYESDMYLQLDLSTFSLVPWESEKDNAVARILCDIYLPNGSPFEGDPRQILRRQVERAQKMGFEYMVGPELEFFLFPLDDNGRPVLEPHDQAGYFDYSGDRAGSIRQAMTDVVSQMGVEVETLHHEVAPGQHEIDFHYSNAIRQADQVITMKSALKAVARKHNLLASFMPKPITGENGSGMHVHQSLWKAGKNHFFDSKAKYGFLSKTALQFIAGQLKHMEAMVAVTNPTVNSYKRLVPGYEAPVYVAWGQLNRSALIRVPRLSSGNENGTRCELRSPDSSSNPYLAFAVMLAAGLDGIERKMTPPDPIDENIYTFTEKKAKRMRIKVIPDSLQKSLNKMKTGELAEKVLGSETFEKFTAAKQMEVDEFRQQVSAWETERYLESL